MCAGHREVWGGFTNPPSRSGFKRFVQILQSSVQTDEVEDDSLSVEFPRTILELRPGHGGKHRSFLTLNYLVFMERSS